MASCQGTTKADNPCKRKAWKGSTFCKLHAPAAEETKSHARANGAGSDFHPCFLSILDWIDELKADPPDNIKDLMTVGRLQHDVTKSAIEDLRLRDGMGAGATYNFTMQPPAEPVEVPVKAVEAIDGDDGRVLN